MSLGELETQNDWNELLACCCPMPLCPVPIPVCKSISAYFSSVGFTDDDDTEFTLYKKQGWVGEWNRTDTENFSGLTGAAATYNGTAQRVLTLELETFFGQTYDILYDGQIGYGGGCPVYAPVLADECSATGSASSTDYAIFGWAVGDAPPVPNAARLEVFTQTAVVSDVSGTETDEHIAWGAANDALVTAWNADHPSGPTWQAAKATHEAWAAAQTTYNDWVACELSTPGDCGAEPANPGTEPTDPGIEDEPTELYGDCTFLTTWSYTWLPAFFGGYPTVDGSEDPSNPAFFDDWVAAGHVDDPPSPGTLVLKFYGAWGTIPSLLNPGFTGSPSYAEVYGVSEPVTYAEWMATVQAIIDANDTLPNVSCGSNECTAQLDKSPEPSVAPFGNDISISSRRSQTQWRIPHEWLGQFTGEPTPFTGDYFGFTYDVLDEPAGWNSTIDDPDYTAPVPNDPPEPIPQIPKPGRPSRSFFLEDQTLEWTGPGTGDASNASWFTTPVVMDPPSTDGIRSIVNLRFICQPDSPWGTLPQVTGRAVTLPDPA